MRIARLTWPWDFEVLREAWNGDWIGLDRPDSRINMFDRAFVDDTFEKILLQRANFDGILDVPQGLRDVIPADAIRPGEVSTGDIDMVTWYILNPPEDDPNTPNVDEAELITRALDLDDSGTITDADRDHVISKLFATRYGDANLNGLFDSADATQVNQAGEYEDATEDNSGWSEGDFNGDLDFFSNDWTKAFQTGGYEWQTDGVDNDGDGVIDETWDNLFDGVDNDNDGQTDELDEGDTEGYRDIDGGKIEDFLPIWAKHLSPGSTFYRPSWGTN